MKNSILLLVAILNINLFSGQPVIYAIHKSALSGDYGIWTIDINTGAKNNFADLPQFECLISSVSAIDATEGIYYFLAADTNSTYNFYAYDINNGDLLSNPIIYQNSNNGILKEMEINRLTGELYALDYKYSDSLIEYSLIKFDPLTGYKNKIGILPNIECTMLGFSALNSQTGVYYFMGLDTNMVSRLYSVNITNGNIIKSPIIYQNANEGYLKELELNQETGDLFALNRTGADPPVVSLVSINPANGNKTTIGIIPDVYLIQNSYSTIVDNTDSYYFVGLDSTDTFNIHGLSTSDGAVLVKIPAYESQTEGNFYEMHYPNLGSALIQTESLNLCNGDSLSLSLPNGYSDYLWSNGAKTQSIYISEPENYSAELTKNYGGTTISNVISIELFDCSTIQDTILYNFDTELLMSQAVVYANAEELVVSNDSVYVVWKFQLENTCSLLENAVYYFQKNGNYVISCQFAESVNSISNTYYDILEIDHIKNIASLDEIQDPELIIYPNPTNNFAKIDLNKEYKHIRIELMTLNGQVIWKKLFDNTSQIELHFMDIQAGLYLLNVIAENDKRLLKLLVSN